MILYLSIKEFVDKYQHITDFTVPITSTVYQHKINPLDVVNSTEELFKRGVNNVDYEEKHTKFYPIMDLIGTTTLNNINKDILLTFANFFKILTDLKLIKNVDKNSPKIKATKKSSISPFKKALNNLNAKLYNAQLKGNISKENQVRKERVQLYIDCNKTPTKRFLDYNLYLELLNSSQKITTHPTQDFTSNNYMSQLSQLKKT